ncbi:RNA 2',3'-cyclic phosphodiesterase [Nocardioides faecalis]|uniref:RNA 2',3'-cyclic phosphodiesterase n=1 Tax=Nocardioides faecalis TaxID=2803858 RepID=UPI0020BE83D3|nr:RNA 2',3'-cyclic phosphodiesterase [Nocardioides faecalis]
MVRLFAAVVPPPQAIEHLDAFLEPRRAAADLRWTRPEQLHLTLAFMAEVPTRRLEPYVETLATSLDDLAPCELSLAGAVVFPDVSRARVLAVGATGAPADLDLLGTLAVRTRNAAVNSGIAVDGQRFRPHVTVARTGGRPMEMTSWVRLLDTYAGPSWSLDSVTLVASHLGEGPRRTPRYETVAQVLL